MVKKSIFFVVILTFGIFLSISYRFIFGSSQAPTYGRIWVDTPEVYTRERLVNDRYVEDAWLREELTATDRLSPEASVVLSSTEASTHNLSTTINAGLESETQLSGAAGSINAPTVSQVKSVNGNKQLIPNLSHMDRFRELLEYRREIRDAIIENQLDDRHDLLGNSLYRLKFDATILPAGPNTKSPARITIRINGPNQDVVEGNPKRLASIYNLGPKELKTWTDGYNRWQRNLKFRLEEEYKNISRMHLAGRLPYSFIKEFYETVIQSKHTFVSEGINIPIRILLDEYSKEDSDKIKKKEIFAALFNLFVKARLSLQESSISSVTSTELPNGTTEQAISPDSRSQSNFAAESDTPSSNTTATLGHVNCPGAALQDQLGDIEYSSYYVQDSEEMFRDQIDTEFNNYLKRKAMSAVFGQPYYSDENEYQGEASVKIRKFAHVRLNWGGGFDDAFTVTTGTTRIELFQLSDEQIKEVSEKAKTIPLGSSNLHTIPLNVDPCLPREKMLAVLIASKSITDTVDLQSFNAFKIPLDIWQQPQLVNHYDVVKDALTNKDLTKAELEQNSLIFVAEWGLANFINALRAHNRAFSYTITPKGAGQLTKIEARRDSSTNLDSSLKAEVVRTGARADFSNSYEILQSQAATMRRPLVVGFSKSRSDETMEIGWDINPGYIDPNSSNPDFKHVAAQYPLTALVSVPAWWRAVELTIETEWLGNDDDGKVIGPIQLVLPVDHEAMEALLLNLNQFGPTINEDEFEKQNLVVGSNAFILIPGKRLWRSTVVTLGGHKADKISVMPNMEGIIAQFLPVKRPNGWLSSTEKMEVPITVWTSQGSAKPSTRVTIYSNSQ